MRLCELREEYRNVMDAIEASCDEGCQIDPELAATLNGIVSDLNTKLGNYAGIIVTLTAQQKIVDAEVERLKRQSKSAGEHIDFLKTAAKLAMVEAGIEKIEAGLRKLRIQNNSQAALTVDATKLAERYWRQPPPVPDNDGIRADIEAGIEVEGAVLQRGTHLRVS